MITLTRLSGSPFVLNSDLIERIDSTPDTVITLIDGSKYVVTEEMHKIVAAIRIHRAEVIALSGYVQVSATLEEFASEPDHPSGAPEPLAHQRPVRLAVVAPPTENPTDGLATDRSATPAQEPPGDRPAGPRGTLEEPGPGLLAPDPLGPLAAVPSYGTSGRGLRTEGPA